MPFFSRYIGIDYSGDETPNASLKGLRVYLAEGDTPPVEVPPPPSPRKYWTRRGIAEWQRSGWLRTFAQPTGIKSLSGPARRGGR